MGKSIIVTFNLISVVGLFATLEARNDWGLLAYMFIYWLSMYMIAGGDA